MLSVHNLFLGLVMLMAVDHTVPKESLRFRHVMEQGLDASCGLATAASALNLYWQIPVLEAELLAGLFTGGANEEVWTDGRVSLASMAAAFEARGVSARAFRLDWDGLEDVLLRGYAPVVVHYDRPDPHFALLLGISGETAVVADPARGLETLAKAGFEKRYSGVALVLASRSRQRNPGRLEEALLAATGKRHRLEQAAERMWPGW
jgi:predicted double-glycine peptidase